MFWDIDHGNPRINEEPREPSRKGDISATVGNTGLQGRTRREQTLEDRNGQVGYQTPHWIGDRSHAIAQATTLAPLLHQTRNQAPRVSGFGTLCPPLWF